MAAQLTNKLAWGCLAVVSAILATTPARAQNMLSRAMVECMMNGIPVFVAPSQQDSYYWRCEGLPAVSLFSEMRGRATERRADNGSFVRWNGPGLSCTQQASLEASCLIAVDIGPDLLREMGR